MAVTSGGRRFPRGPPAHSPRSIVHRLSSAICKIQNNGQICENIINSFFGFLESILRNFRWHFTGNRIKPTFLGCILGLSLFQFSQYSTFSALGPHPVTHPGKRLAHHLCQSSTGYMCTVVCALSLFRIAFSQLCFQVSTQIPPSWQTFSWCKSYPMSVRPASFPVACCDTNVKGAEREKAKYNSW